MKFHWKILFWAIFFSPPFPVPNLERAHLEHGKASPHVLDKRYVDFSVIMYFPQMFLQSCMNHETSPIPQSNQNHIGPYLISPFFSATMLTFLGPARVFCADEVLTEGARKASLWKHSSATAEAQTKRKAQALTPQSIPKAQAYQKVQTSKPNRIYKSEMTWLFKNA